MREGNACREGEMCMSTICESTDVTGEMKVCCSKACGLCSNCTGDGKSCIPVMYGDDVDSCNGRQSCSAGECLVVDIDRRFDGWMGLAGRGGVAYLAQTLTVPLSGEIVELRLQTSCRTPISFQGVSSDGTPDGRERAVTRRPILIVPANTNLENDGTYAFPLQSPLRVSDGERLAFVMQNMDCFTDMQTNDMPGQGGEVFVRGTGLWEKESGYLLFMLLVRH
jgi:hypothetical protein